MESSKENKLGISIKSVYILKQILSLLDVKKKLKLISYNKNLQNKLKIDQMYFEKISGKKIIGEKDGKGKEYRDNKLVFQGFYLNRKRNGLGKEYYPNGNIKFVGEFSNNNKIKGIEYDYEENILLKFEKDGKGKEYYFNGKTKFEGEFKNGNKWNGIGFNINGKKEFELKNGEGKIKEYNYKGNEIEFEGEYVKGKRWNGKGKEYSYYSQLSFEGEYIKGKRSGIIKEYYYNGKLKFEGKILNEEK